MLLLKKLGKLLLKGEKKERQKRRYCYFSEEFHDLLCINCKEIGIIDDACPAKSIDVRKLKRR